MKTMQYSYSPDPYHHVLQSYQTPSHTAPPKQGWTFLEGAGLYFINTVVGGIVTTVTFTILLSYNSKESKLKTGVDGLTYALAMGMDFIFSMMIPLLAGIVVTIVCSLLKTSVATCILCNVVVCCIGAVILFYSTMNEVVEKSPEDEQP